MAPNLSKQHPNFKQRNNSVQKLLNLRELCATHLRCSCTCILHFLASSAVCEFHGDDLLLTTCLKDSNKDGLVTLFDFLAEFIREFLVIICGLTDLCEARQVEIILGFTALEQEAHFARSWVRAQTLELIALDKGNFDVVRSWAEVLVLLGGEDVECDDVCLCMPMLSCL